MKVVADLHIHSRFSRCCSKNITIPELAKWAEIKGIDILATSDFTHPQWLAEIKENLKDNGQGLFVFKNGEYKTHFILSTEVSCIYKRDDQCRQLHLCVLFPSIEAVEKFNNKLESLDKNLKSDGRPILGLDVREIVDIALNADEKALIIPAHIWTPWFAMFGSKSGFNSAKECFGEYIKHIYAIETGLSTDPLMNWMVSDLDKFLLVSNSDAHSPENLGREANAWELENFSYNEIYNLFKTKDKNKFLYTIEFYPEEGKYHFDGHLKCGTFFNPQETKKNKGLCPVCKKPLVIGTMNRVMELADRSLEEVEKIRDQFVPYKSLIPLKEIIGEIESVGSKSKKVDRIYHELIKKGENEFNVLLNIEIEVLKSIGGEVFAEAIKRMRAGEVHLQPGYDGKYGVIKVFNEDELKKIRGEQKILF
jgi:ATP-dependent DNA helicase UvrD/PcrA